MTFLENVFDKVRRHPKRIVFPEGDDPRVIEAAANFFEQQLGAPVLLGNEKIIRETARRARIRLDHILVLNPETAQDLHVYADKYSRLRRGIRKEEALRAMINPIYFATMMLHEGSVDGFVAGVRHSAGLILRPLFQLIHLQESFRTASSCSILHLPGRKLGEEGVLYLADCNVIPDPGVEQIVDIALCAAMLARQIHGVKPRVAMLSFSDRGSARHAMSAKMAAATALAQQRAQQLRMPVSIDGEMHADTALSPLVCEMKNIKGPVAGRANVLVFPDLSAANIAAKLLHEIAAAPLYGPLLCGLNKPASDLMRNASADEILASAAIVALQAIEYRRLYPGEPPALRREAAAGAGTASWN